MGVSSFYRNGSRDDSNNVQASERTPLLNASSNGSPDVTFRIPGKSGSGSDPNQEPKKDDLPASLFKVLVKTYGFELLQAHFCKLIYDLLQYVNPVLLGVLINYTKDRQKMEDQGQEWKGFVYASAFFVVSELGSIMFNQNFHIGLSLGMRIKAALIAAVYKKSLTVSNESKKETTVGEIVNLMSVDCQRMQDVTGYLWMLWSAPLQISLALYLLWGTLGPSTLAGLAVMLLLMPLNGLIAAKQRKYQIQQMKFKDQRIKLMTEVLNGMKVLKLYAWEPSFQEKVEEIRQEELKVLRNTAYLNACSTFFWTCAPFFVTLATFATYVLVSESHYLDADKAFVALSLFNLLRFPISLLPMLVSFVVQASVSVKRIGKFLRQDDLDTSSVQYNPDSEDAIRISRGTFTWDKTNPKPTLSDIKVSIPEGKLVAVVGQVGAGKSSLISAMLGEMEKLQGTVTVKSSIAYVPQQAWIQNATVRDNILFGSEHNPRVYDKVIESCALTSDLEILAGGDLTEIGEKGINLSGGQKQRVSLARAVYSDADIYLLDDPLSAVDSHVGKHIFDKVISHKGMLKRKTRILVTHGVHWLPQVDHILVVTDGRISESGSYEELLSHDGVFAQFLKTYLTQDQDEEEDDEDPEIAAIKARILERVDSVTSDTGATSGDEVMASRRRASRSLSRQFSKSGEKLAEKKKEKPKAVDRLTEEEKAEVGKVALSVFLDYFQAIVAAIKARILERVDSVTSDTGATSGDEVMASRRRASRSLSRQFSKSGEKLAEKKKEKPKAVDRLTEEEKAEVGKVALSVFLDYFQAIGILATLAFFFFFACYQGVNVYSSIWLSQWTADSVLQNRSLSNTSEYSDRNEMYLGVYGGLGAVQAILILFYAIIAAIRMVKAAGALHHNMLSNIMRSPMVFFDTTPSGRILNRFSRDVETIDNLIPQQLRSWMSTFFGTVSTIVVISYSTPIFMVVILPLGILYYLIQSYERSKVQYMAIRNLWTWWLSVRLEFLGNLLVLAAAMFAVVSKDVNQSLVGLSVSYALQITGGLNWLVRMTTDLETNIVSVERVKEYTETPTEAAWVNPFRRPSSNWPTEGSVSFIDYKMRYRDGQDPILKGISCTIQGGEKIGIVGRTGAGKSSMTVSLFRLIEALSGSIIIDGTSINDIGLHDLRSRLTILPQDPVLFSGTLRMNLDPFDTYDDATIWRALEHAHLKSFVEGTPNMLQYQCGEGGQNLSVGQRQLVCLARSLLRKTRILVLDEATAAVDMETDDLIQATIRSQFTDCTILTIAHRLNTIMDYDRIMVLASGEIKELDTPSALLENKNSMFYAMAKDANLV
ncbi:multidrug resistance-associated protein 1 [Elysia marginata]|uniref:Multidrug resistance-associated protein 1 n=1 Tax=Elysia marginata TaxID=1093978 RepID=A0AAV4HLA3_9GAST|nr:multidrug resistance-associated protein 1 [Elysia marginata]